MRRRVSPAERFRARARRWFAEAPRRLGLARLHAQMARLATVEQDAIACPYCRPAPGVEGRACSREHAPRSFFEELPKHPDELTVEEQAQIENLREIAASAFDRMDRLAPGWSSAAKSYVDFAFGRESEDA